MARSLPRFRPQLFAFAVFLGTMCALAAALTWLCWRLLEQDRQLESQRVQERLEQAADRTASAFESEIGDLDRWLAVPAGRQETPPDGVALLAKTEAGLIIRPTGRLLYLPPATPGANTVDRLFAAGEVLEFRERDAAGAAEVFRKLSQSPNPEVRAGALMRLGRNLRKLGRYGEALEVYRRLQLAPNVVIEGTPAGLLALDARCSVLEALGRRDALRKEALVLDAGLRMFWPYAVIVAMPAGSSQWNGVIRHCPQFPPQFPPQGKGRRHCSSMAQSTRASCRTTSAQVHGREPGNRGQTGRSPCRKPGSDVPDVSSAPGFRPPELFGRKRHTLRQLPFTLRLAQEPDQRMPVPCPRRTRHTPHSLFESALRIRVGLSGQAGANGVEDRPRDRQPLARLID